MAAEYKRRLSIYADPPAVQVVLPHGLVPQQTGTLIESWQLPLRHRALSFIGMDTALVTCCQVFDDITSRSLMPHARPITCWRCLACRGCIVCHPAYRAATNLVDRYVVANCGPCYAFQMQDHMLRWPKLVDELNLRQTYFGIAARP